MKRERIILLGLLFFGVAGLAWTQAPTEPSKVKLVGPATIITIDPEKNQTEAVLTLKNDSAQPVTITLAAKPGDNSPVQVMFSAEKDTGAGSGSYSLSVPANGTANARAVVHSESPKEVKIDISDQATSAKLGAITVRHAPFSLKLDSPNPAKLALIQGRRIRLILKNEDDVGHTVKWKLQSPAFEICSGDQLVVPAKGVGILDCVPDWRRTSGYFQNLLRADQSRDGYMLELYSRDAGELALAPAKIIPAEASLDYVDPLRRRFLNTLTVILVLVVGGLCSLVLNFSIPNRLLRLNASERISNLARKTADLSTRVDSRLSVLLRLERSRLGEQLKSRWSLSPDFGGVVSQVSAALSKLEIRLGLIQQIDLVLGRLEKILPLGVAPSLIEELETSLHKTSVLLGKTDPGDGDIQVAQTIISDAATRVDTLIQPSADFGSKLASSITDFLSSLADIKETDTFERITAAVPGPFRQLRQLPAAATTVLAGTEAAFDMALQQMKLIGEYVRRVENTKDPERLKRLTDREKDLLGWLQNSSWQALQAARLLVREMADNVYPDDLRKALLAGEAVIGMDPAIAYEQAALDFNIVFNDRRHDTASAREEWSCRWSFGDGLAEKGWSVSHYYLLRDRKVSLLGRLRALFSRKEPETAPGGFFLTATFIDENGKQIVNQDGAVAPVARSVQVRTRAGQGIGERTVTEGIKLAAALLIAVFALLSGGQTQLDKLDVLPGLVAVFMVGFGADTIKNILSAK